MFNLWSSFEENLHGSSSYRTIKQGQFGQMAPAGYQHTNSEQLSGFLAVQAAAGPARHLMGKQT